MYMEYYCDADFVRGHFVMHLSHRGVRFDSLQSIFIYGTIIFLKLHVNFYGTVMFLRTKGYNKLYYIERK